MYPGMLVWFPMHKVHAVGPAEMVKDGRVMAEMPVSLAIYGVMEPSWLAGTAEPTPLLVQGVGIGIVEVSG